MQYGAIQLKEFNGFECIKQKFTVAVIIRIKGKYITCMETGLLYIFRTLT